MPKHRPPTTEIGALLRQIRADRGWTVAELARRASLSQGHVTKIEIGTVQPTTNVLDQLAIAFRCNPAILYRTAALVPDPIRQAFSTTPELFLLLAKLAPAERRRIHGDLAEQHRRADPLANEDWVAAEKRRKALKKKLMQK